jgi:hypothetical protein
MAIEDSQDEELQPLILPPSKIPKVTDYALKTYVELYSPQLVELVSTIPTPLSGDLSAIFECIQLHTFSDAELVELIKYS